VEENAKKAWCQQNEVARKEMWDALPTREKFQDHTEQFLADEFPKKMRGARSQWSHKHKNSWIMWSL
jgi:hypothetical protein